MRRWQGAADLHRIGGNLAAKAMDRADGWIYAAYVIINLALFTIKTPESGNPLYLFSSTSLSRLVVPQFR